MATSYDEFLYPCAPRPQSHAAVLAALAAMHGLTPAPLDGCRVLELACNDGGNLIPIAFDHPGARCLGVDIAEAPLVAGRKLASSLGLRNIEFVQGDLMNWQPEGGPFDYIVAHGLYSWVPQPVRDSLLRLCAAHLAPHGVAFISYNALPGCYFRLFIWDMLKFHTRGITDPVTMVAEAKSLARTMVQVLDSNGYQGVMRTEFQQVVERHDSVLFHDDLSPVNTPFSVLDFTRHAETFGLRYLSDAEFVREHGVPFPLPVADVVEERQYADFISARRFRETLLCRADAPVTQQTTFNELSGLYLASNATAEPEESDGTQRFSLGENKSLSTNFPHVKKLLLDLNAMWPASARVDALGLLPGQPEQAAECILRLYLSGAVELRSEPPRLAAVPGPRPVASALARAQIEAGRSAVTNQRHKSVDLADVVGRRLLCLLDGTRDIDQIFAEISGIADPQDTTATPEQLRANLSVSLSSIARLSLLTG